MKLLLTGPLLDFSGFAHASRDILRMLLESDELDIVIRPLRYDQLDPGQEFEVPDWMQPLLEKDLMNVDMVLQITTCNVEAVPIPGVVNGLYTFFETNRLQPNWAAKAQEFDFLIVPSRFNAEALGYSGVTKPVLVAAPPCDEDTYKREYTPFEIADVEGRTVFYNICQLSTKKGIDVLLRAYYAAFAGAPDDVLLVLKTYVDMQNRQNDFDIVKGYIEGIKARCRIPVEKLPPVLPVVYTMTDDEIHGLHTRGDAYVCSSRAEGWGLPVFDAMAHGNTVISHDKSGLGDFVSRENCLLYGGTPSFFYDMPHPDPLLFTGIEQCLEPSPVELALTMQQFHLLRKGNESDELDEAHQEQWSAVLQRRENAAQVGQRFDYRNISGKVVTQLLAALKSWKETGVVSYDATAEGTVVGSLEDQL